MPRSRHQKDSVLRGRFKPGERLRAARVSRGLTLRDVYRASLTVARQLGDSDFAVPASRLHHIETTHTVPGVHKLYTLACVYQCEVNEVLSWYGIPRHNLLKVSAGT
jgi:transcriptional regulator with XRE-family HTH domain